MPAAPAMRGAPDVYVTCSSALTAAFLSQPGTSRRSRVWPRESILSKFRRWTKARRSSCSTHVLIGFACLRVNTLRGMATVKYFINKWL